VASDPNPAQSGDTPEESTPPLAPPETKSLAEIHAALEPPGGKQPANDGGSPADDAPSQFSLRELLAIVTIVSLELAGLRWLYWLKPKHAAGLVGFVAVGWLVVMTLIRLPPRLANIIWWSLVILYLLVLAVTFASAAVGAD